MAAGFCSPTRRTAFAYRSAAASEGDMTRRNSHAFISATALGIMGSAALAAAPPNGGEQGHTLLAFHSMYGVDGPFVGNTFPLRGIPGDELPWTVASAVGRLDTDGHLTIQVRGLVFTDDEEVPPELRGINDEPTFRAAVSCITEKGERVVRRNVVTEPFPATRNRKLQDSRHRRAAQPLRGANRSHSRRLRGYVVRRRRIRGRGGGGMIPRA